MQNLLKFSATLGLAGGLIWVALHYLRYAEFTWLGLLFALVMFLSALITGLLFRSKG